MDVSIRSLEIAHRRLRLDRLPEKQRERIRLIHGSLTYRDERLQGYDAAAIVEVIEHLDPSRLAAFERVVFEQALALLAEYKQGAINDSQRVLVTHGLFHRVILRCVIGSRAYGLDTEESDTDRRGIYLPADLHWSLYGVPEQLEDEASFCAFTGRTSVASSPCGLSEGWASWRFLPRCRRTTPRKAFRCCQSSNSFY